MATCEYCGTTYRGGAAVHGTLRFCTHSCRERGKKLELLDDFPPKVIDAEISALRSGPCAECGSLSAIDAHKSHFVHSIVLWTTWRSTTDICCKPCGRKHQFKAIGYCGLLGWWGIPFGIIITPVQIFRNALAIMRRDDQPSNAFVRISRLHLADRIIAASRPHENHRQRS